MYTFFLLIHGPFFSSPPRTHTRDYLIVLVSWRVSFFFRSPNKVTTVIECLSFCWLMTYVWGGFQSPSFFLLYSAELFIMLSEEEIRSSQGYVSIDWFMSFRLEKPFFTTMRIDPFLRLSITRRFCDVNIFYSEGYGLVNDEHDYFRRRFNRFEWTKFPFTHLAKDGLRFLLLDNWYIFFAIRKISHYLSSTRKWE